jgi:hypothetical protein
MPMNLRTPLVALGLLALGLAAVPPAAADLPTLDVSTAAAVDAGLLSCRSTPGDWDRDGESETWNVCSTPTCGCACPVVGAGLVVEAAGQERGAWVATSGCQTGYGTMADEGDGDQTVTPFVWTWGLPPIATN